MKPTYNPSTQYVLQAVPTATCFGCVNSHQRAVQKKIRCFGTVWLVVSKFAVD